eukprot:gene7521-8352_t
MRIRNIASNGDFENLQNALVAITNRINELSDVQQGNDGDRQNVVGRLPRLHVDADSGRLQIDRNKIERFLNMGLSVRYIARNSERLLGGRVHYNTIHRFIRRNNLVSPRQRFTEINDQNLFEIVHQLNRQFPNSGAGEMLALLRARTPSIIIPRDRCRRVLGEVDPEGTARRWAQAIRRRQYSVPTPNSLWHLDTNHALIRWNFVINGGIDGFSRLVSHLRVTSDNTAISALRVFITGIRNFGVPSRIRVDGGSEFSFVRGLMNSLNGDNRHSAIEGSSVHNQRIERLWRDVYAKVLDKYYKLFYHMEDHNILCLENDIHMFCLHHVFLSRLQRNLTYWSNAHNNHAIRTEHHRTPLQIWFSSNLRSFDENNTAMNNLFRRNITGVGRTIADYFRNNDLVEPGNITVVLPRIVRPLTNAQFENLQNNIDVLADSASEGLDIYGRVVIYVSGCIR